MRIVALTVAALVSTSASAFAQYGYPPRPAMGIGPIPPEGVFEMVRGMGLQPIGPPMRNGPVYIQRAADYYGKPLRVVVDASRAQVVSVEAVGGPPMLHGGPYASMGSPYWRRPYYGAMAPDDDGFAPPGSVMAPPGSMVAPRAHPPQPALPHATHSRPAAKSAAITPGRPPAPRKRPPSAPQEAAGSVEPLQATPQPPTPAAAPPATAPTSAAPTMPPVAPLE